MRIFVDNRLMQKIIDDESMSRALLKIGSQLKSGGEQQTFQLSCGWPSFLELIGITNLFETFPKFDDQNKLFAFTLSILTSNPDKEVVIELYERIFVECLTQVKSLAQINAAFLIEKIRAKRESLSASADQLLAPALAHYEKYFIEASSNAMHDLILYLAWNRVCVDLAILFDSSQNLQLKKEFDIFMECLIESFQHITGQGKSAPGFFIMIEALYAYQMREENIQLHSGPEWLVLCQSAQALKSREQLSDVFYIDDSIVDQEQLEHAEPVYVLTLDSETKVQSTLSLTNEMIKKIKNIDPSWHYKLGPVKILCVEEKENGLEITTTI